MVKKNRKSPAKKSTKKKTVKKPATKKSTVKKQVTKKSAKRKIKKRAVRKKIAGRKSPGQKQKNKTNGKSGQNEEIEQTLVLSSVLGTNNASGLYSRFGRTLSLKLDVSIDASAVKMVDTAVLQLLLAFVRKIESRNLSVTWINPSDEFCSRAHSLNLAEALGLNGAGG